MHTINIDTKITLEILSFIISFPDWNWSEWIVLKLYSHVWQFLVNETSPNIWWQPKNQEMLTIDFDQKIQKKSEREPKEIRTVNLHLSLLTDVCTIAYLKKKKINFFLTTALNSKNTLKFKILCLRKTRWFFCHDITF